MGISYWPSPAEEDYRVLKQDSQPFGDWTLAIDIVSEDDDSEEENSVLSPVKEQQHILSLEKWRFVSLGYADDEVLNRTQKLYFFACANRYKREKQIELDTLFRWNR